MLSLQAMREFKSILLIFIMGIILFPWQSICVVHPLGHKHHHHNGPSPCELRRIAAEQEGEHILPPMECRHLLSQIDKLQKNQFEKIAPNIQLFAILAVVFELVNFDNYKQPFLFPPDPQCRSATLITDNPLRGPPLV